MYILDDDMVTPNLLLENVHECGFQVIEGVIKDENNMDKKLASLS